MSTNHTAQIEYDKTNQKLSSVIEHAAFRGYDVSFVLDGDLGAIVTFTHQDASSWLSVDRRAKDCTTKSIADVIDSFVTFDVWRYDKYLPEKHRHA